LYDYSTFTWEIWHRICSGWREQNLCNFLKDASQKDTDKTVLMQYGCRWYNVFCKENSVLFAATEGPNCLKDGDIITCPSLWNVHFDLTLDEWVKPATKARMIENVIFAKTGVFLEITPKPLTHDDLLHSQTSHIVNLIRGDTDTAI